MSRPKQSKRVIRNHLFSMRLSDIELDLLRIKSKDAGMSASELMRRNGLLRPLPRRSTKISLQIYLQLGRIGNDLNQLVELTNTAIGTGCTPSINLALLEELLDVLHRCRREIAQVDTHGERDFEEGDEDYDDWETDEG
jgi:hypothetical protein